MPNKKAIRLSILMGVLMFNSCLLDKGPAKSEFTNPENFKINEIFAQSQTEEDWFELYVSGEKDVELSDYRVVDGKSGRPVFELPSGTVKSGSYIQILAVDTPYAGTAVHVPFKLGKSDEIRLYFGDNLADKVKWDEAVWKNKNSLGRSPDGTDNFVSMSPTPGSKNNIPLESD